MVSVNEELAKMSFPSMTMIVDASPKAKMDVPGLNHGSVMHVPWDGCATGVGSAGTGSRDTGELGSSTNVRYSDFAGLE